MFVSERLPKRNRYQLKLNAIKGKEKRTALPCEKNPMGHCSPCNSLALGWHHRMIFHGCPLSLFPFLGGLSLSLGLSGPVYWSNCTCASLSCHGTASAFSESSSTRQHMMQSFCHLAWWGRKKSVWGILLDWFQLMATARRVEPSGLHGDTWPRPLGVAAHTQPLQGHAIPLHESLLLSEEPAGKKTLLLNSSTKCFLIFTPVTWEPH